MFCFHFGECDFRGCIEVHFHFQEKFKEPRKKKTKRRRRKKTSLNGFEFLWVAGQVFN